MTLPEDKTVIQVVVPVELKEWLLLKAKQDRRSLSNFACVLLDQIRQNEHPQERHKLEVN